MLKNDSLAAKIGVDRAENEPSTVMLEEITPEALGQLRSAGAKVPAQSCTD